MARSKNQSGGRGILAERRAIRKKAARKKTKLSSSSLLRTSSQTTEQKRTVKREQTTSPLATSTTNSMTTASLDFSSTPLVAKAEYSPNALARCHVCRKKIKKEQKRFGIPEHSDRYNKEIYRYFHYNCCPASLKSQVPTAETDLKQQKQQAAIRQKVIAQRHELVETLKELRRVFASRLNVSPFIVFSNATLEELVYKMPTDEIALLNVKGIGPGKLQSFGHPIIQVIQQYQQKRLGRATTTTTVTTRIKGETQPQKPSRRQSTQAPEVIVLDDSDNEDKSPSGTGEEIAIGETLTCEELVNRKFEHAAANGYVISVD